MKNKSIKILAIETSCDETAACVMRVDTIVQKVKNETRPVLDTGAQILPQTKTLSSIINSQVKLHSKMGGVVPETAARAHVKNIRPIVEAALKSANLQLTTINYLAVTQGPGLLPSLMVGVEFAKALSFATSIPLIPVNHMLGHLYSPLVGVNSKFEIRNSKFPLIALVVSGGHTMLVLMKDLKNYKVIGQTVDDAAGESFDKVAKMLELSYPGGPEVSKLAELGTPGKIEFPRPMIHDKTYNFSFSGLKTSVLYFIKDNGLKIKDTALKADICRAFQDSVIDVLVTKTMRAVKEFGAKTVTLSGGVAANKALREQLIIKCGTRSPDHPELVEGLKVEFLAAPMNLCGDNAEMIALAAAIKLQNGYKPVLYKKIQANPNLEI